MNGDELKTKRLFYRIKREDVCFLRFVIEGYDGLTIMTTLDSRTGLVSLAAAPGCEFEIKSLMEDMRREMWIEPVSDQALKSLPGFDESVNG